MSGDSDATATLADPEPFEAIVDGSTTGPLAVLGDPYAGRERVLDAAADRLDAVRVRLQPGDGVARVRNALDGAGEDGRAADDRPVVVDDCQHLYTRAIGGFEPLDAFLDLLSGTGRTVVAGWNRYAWAYLTAVRSVDLAFEETVDVGPVEADRLAELVLARYDSHPAFERDDVAPSGPVSVRRYRLELGGRTLSLPVPVPAFGASRSDPGADVDPRDLVFERLAAAADGNVGVATALWERSRAETVRPSDVAVPGSDLDLDREEAFCLRIVLSKERLRRSELDRLLDGNADRVLARLRRAGVVTVTDDEVRLDPAAVPTAVDSTEREGLL